MDRRFADRYAAGRLLAEALPEYRDDLLVLALPRGGVPVGYEVARALDAELDVLVICKLGVPKYPELAMGAIGSGGALYLNEQVIDLMGVKPPEIEVVLEEKRHELARREARYRGKRLAANVLGRTVVIVDDGIATGASMRVAIMTLRSTKPARLIIAVPVAPAGAKEQFEGLADAFFCLLNPSDFVAVGQFYTEFDPTSDEEVRTLLGLIS